MRGGGSSAHTRLTIVGVLLALALLPLIMLESSPLARALLTLCLCLLLTELIELAVARGMGVRDGRGQRIVALAQVATNPVVVLGTLILPAAWLPFEAAAVALEAFLYARTGISDHPVRLSVICNLVSLLAGVLVGAVSYPV